MNTPAWFNPRLLFSVLLIVFSSSISAAQQKAPKELQPVIAQLDRVVSEMVKDPRAASFTLGLVNKDGLVWSRSYGFAEIETKTPATPESVYRIGSITKQFTGLMLLQLAHEGKVHFSDQVEKYFPEIHLIRNEYKGAPPITLIQLATHTSGLAAEPEDMSTYVKGPVSEWEKTLIAALPHTRFKFEPGTHCSYSNIGYAILGASLARAAHQPFTDYVKEKILRPLGMTHTDFEATPAIRQKLARGYDVIFSDGKFDADTAEREHAGRGYKVPNGALYTTVADVARFEGFEMFGDDKVLPKKELEENWTRMLCADPELRVGYGPGFHVRRIEGKNFVGHAGGVIGYTAMAFFQPEAQVGIIILRNETAEGMDKILDAFAQSLPVKSDVKQAQGQ
jgi:CubicO group peptidase (beta-lactamase class C family)